MSRSHARGHHSSADETIAVRALEIISVLQNNLTQENSGGAIAAATPVVWDSSSFTTNTGKVKIRATMVTTGGSGGATSTAGELVEFQLRMDGAVMATAPITADTLEGATVVAPGTLMWTVSGLTKGSAHTFGIQAVNTTTAGHTLSVAQYGAVIDIQDSY